jgi:hypothetical protein
MSAVPHYSTAAPVIANGANMSSAICVRDARTGLLTLPAAMTANAVTFRTSPTLDGTFSTLKDSSGTNVSVTIANSGSVQLPAALFAGAHSIKIVGNANEAAARTLTVELKS